jgi:hypothetical protein
MQAGECRSKAGGCVILRGHRPQCPCHQRAADRSALQREEGQQALGSLRQDQLGAFVLQLEAAEKGHPHGSSLATTTDAHSDHLSSQVANIS